MIHNLKTALIFYCKLWWAKRQRESLWKDIEAQTKKAKTEDEREQIWQENDLDEQTAQQNVQLLQAGYYGNKARRKGIPTPKAKEDWERLVTTADDRVMTVEAIAKLRSAIRQEHRELRDVILPYAAIIISVVAIVFSFLNYRKPLTQQIVVPVQPIILPTPAPTPTPALVTKPIQTKPHQSKP
jgi:hypothetical protein